MVLHSICMLCSNDGDTVRDSVESLLELCRTSEGEIVVVDNMSTDGSFETLTKFGPPVRVFRAKCSRGRGREIAFRRSVGRYVISHLDCDDVFSSKGLYSLLKTYHSKYEGNLLLTKRSAEYWYAQSSVSIAPRELLARIGGWRDINWYEDWDVWARAAGIGSYAFLPYPESDSPHASTKTRWDRFRKFTLNLRTTYAQYRDSVKIGRAIVREGERVQFSAFGIGRGYLLATARLVGWAKRDTLRPVPDPFFNEWAGGSRFTQN